MAAEIDALPGDVRSLALPTDVSDEAAVAHMAAASFAAFGQIDILVNNAGVGKNGTVATRSARLITTGS